MLIWTGNDWMVQILTSKLKINQDFYLVGDLLKFKKTKEVFVPFTFSATFSSTFCESWGFMWNKGRHQLKISKNFFLQQKASPGSPFLRCYCAPSKTVWQIQEGESKPQDKQGPPPPGWKLFVTVEFTTISGMSDCDKISPQRWETRSAQDHSFLLSQQSAPYMICMRLEWIPFEIVAKASYQEKEKLFQHS